MGVAHVTSEERSNKVLGVRGEEVRMIGYSEEMKNSYLCKFRNGSILNRRDVHWDLTDRYAEHDIDNINMDTIFGYEDLKKRGLKYPYFEPEEDDVLSNSGDENNLEVEDLTLPETPDTINQALNGIHSKEWADAIEKELSAIDKRKTLLKVNTHGRAMKSRMVFKVSFKDDYSLKFKARLVACGYSQIYGIDYKETFSPTSTFSSILWLLGLCATFDLFMSGLDVTNAYLESRNDYKNYLRLPKELDESQSRYEVVGALYGEKQSGKCWADRLTLILSDMSFKRCISDPCIFVRRTKDTFMVLCIYVDDIIIISNIKNEVENFKLKMLDYVQEIKDLGYLNKHLGIDIIRDHEKKIIEISHDNYINDYLNNYISDNDRVRTSPMGTSVKYRQLPSNNDNESLLPVLGKLRYTADRTRPDILVGCSIVASNAIKPNDQVIVATIRILQYLRTTLNVRLHLGGLDKNITLFGFADASTGMAGDGRPQIGVCFYMNTTSGAFYSMSKLMKLIATSSTHGEIIGIEMFCRINENIRLMYEEIGIELSKPTTLFVDSEPSIKLMDTLKQSNRTKHINLKINYIREQINSRKIKLSYVPSAENIADILTKPITGDQFHKLRRNLMFGFDGRMPGTVSR
jgi:hypothetical protein